MMKCVVYSELHRASATDYGSYAIVFASRAIPIFGLSYAIAEDVDIYRRELDGRMSIEFREIRGLAKLQVGMAVCAGRPSSTPVAQCPTIASTSLFALRSLKLLGFTSQVAQKLVYFSNATKLYREHASIFQASVASRCCPLHVYPARPYITGEHVMFTPAGREHLVR